MTPTKGEWKIMPYTRRDGDNIRWVKAVRGKQYVPICQTFSPNAEANARLIAAAPDLLAACETALPFVVAHDIQQKVVSGAALKLQAAIAKAKKEG